MARTTDPQAVTPWGRLWQSDIRPTLALGLPLAGAQLAQMAINTTDVLMIGRLGAEKLAGSVLAFNMFMVTWFFGMGLIQAVIPLGAKARGRRETREFRRIVRMGLWISVLYCLPAWCAMLFAEEILIALGQQPEIARLAGEYMIVLQWSLLPALMIMALRGFLTVMEKSRVVLIATICGALVNALLDYALIFGAFGLPRLELVGAGIASVFSSATTAAVLLYYVTHQRQLKRYAILGRIWRSDWTTFFRIIRVGTPIAITIVAEAALFAASAILIGWTGALPLAAHGIALQIASLTFMVPVGLSQAALTRVGLAAGRNDNAAIGRAGWSAFGITLMFMTSFALLFWTVPEAIISLYLDFDNPQSGEVLALAVSFLAVAALFQIADGAQIIGVNNLRGLGDTAVPLAYALVGYWVIGISLSLGLGIYLEWGGVGVWSGLAGGLATVAVLANIRFIRRQSLGLV
ncbi:MATE family efflux transporter [Roseibium limicola]